MFSTKVIQLTIPIIKITRYIRTRFFLQVRLQIRSVSDQILKSKPCFKWEKKSSLGIFTLLNVQEVPFLRRMYAMSIGQDLLDISILNDAPCGAHEETETPLSSTKRRHYTISFPYTTQLCVWHGGPKNMNPP